MVLCSKDAMNEVLQRNVEDVITGADKANLD